MTRGNEGFAKSCCWWAATQDAGRLSSSQSKCCPCCCSSYATQLTARLCVCDTIERLSDIMRGSNEVPVRRKCRETRAQRDFLRWPPSVIVTRGLTARLYLSRSVWVMHSATQNSENIDSLKEREISHTDWIKRRGSRWLYSQTWWQLHQTENTSHQLWGIIWHWMALRWTDAQRPWTGK